MSDLPNTRSGPLSGIRVLELTKVWAGPYAGKLLAQLGAEVIKIESKSNLDEMRAYGGVDINSAPYFLSINQEVQSVQVNLKSEKGLDLLKQMIAQSDILIDNIRPGAMERSGLDYESLRQVKPDLIQCSIKMWGADGPLKHQTGYAPCFAALSGLTALVGHEGETPQGMNIRYGDSTAGAYAAMACVAALHHRESTGEGQFIDVSAVEAMSSLIGDSLFAWSVTGEIPQADGNAHCDMAPHGAYPCADQSWISIAVTNDQEWAALCDVIEAPSLANEPRFKTLDQRLSNRHELDHELAQFTQLWDASELAEKLLHSKVSAFKSMSSIDLCTNDVLWSTEAFRMVSDHRNGTRPVIGPSWQITPDPPRFENGAPRLGEHNDYVYGTLLGLPRDEIDVLIAQKVID